MSICAKLVSLIQRRKALDGGKGAKVILEVSDPYKIVPMSEFKQLTEKALVFLGREGDYALSLAIVDDGEIKELNRHHRQQDKATDVLSFSFLSKEGADKFPAVNEGQDLGEIIVSHETAGRQAQEEGHSLPEELRALYTHGLLHLLGYDHQAAEQRRTMEKLAAKILNS